MHLRVTYYLEVISSWCYWAEPTFLLEDAIGDRSVFSGLIAPEPLTATLDAMLRDCRAYASWKAHVGDPPVP